MDVAAFHVHERQEEKRSKDQYVFPNAEDLEVGIAADPKIIRR